MGLLTWCKSSHWLIIGKICPIDNYFILGRSFVKLAGNEDIYNISDKYDFGPDRTIHFGVTRPWATKIFPIDL